jgi:DNA repair protein RecO (recombination protein O)
MRNIQTEGIVLKKTPVNETDLFVSIFSPLLGKIDAIAKGARKVESHFTGHLELLNTCTFQLYNKGNRYIITQCQSTRTHKSLRNSLDKTGSSLLVLEIFSKVSSNEEYGYELSGLFQECLECMGNDHSTFLCTEIFKIKLLKILGALPDITHCGICNRRWENMENMYLENQGQLLCRKCLDKTHIFSTIQFNIIKLINYICTEKFQNILRIKISPREKIILKNFSDTFLNIYLQTELKSETVIASIKPW